MTDDPRIEQLFGARTAKLVEHVVDAATAARIRQQLEQVGYVRPPRIDEGRYELAMPSARECAIDPLRTVLGELVKLAGKTRVLEARALRLSAGDYLLAHADRVHEGHPVEVMLDLSPSAVPAEVHYRRRGQVYFRFPCTPGAAAIVERGPTVTCNHTYVSKLHPDASIVRLVALCG